MHAAEDIAQQEAKHMGFPCIIIRMGVHGSTRVLDKTIRHVEMTARRRGLSNPIKLFFPLCKDSTRTGAPTTRIVIDHHITVYLGKDWDHCQVEGHIFVSIDPVTGIPKRKLKSIERVHVEPSHAACGAEYWRYPE